MVLKVVPVMWLRMAGGLSCVVRMDKGEYVEQKDKQGLLTRCVEYQAKGPNRPPKT